MDNLYPIFFPYFFVFVLGLIFGSFLNSLIYRIETGKNFFKKRSFCPHCQHTLSWKDLIPLLSFLILQGKCRYCQKPISWQYPLVELATGFIFLLIFHYSISNLQFLIYNLLISCFLIVIFVFDLKHYLIPDTIIYPAILIAIIWHFVFWFFGYYPLYEIRNAILSALGSSFFFLTIYLISQGKWLGFGDVNLAFLMGLFLGWPKILVALFFAFFIGALVGILLIILGKKKMKSEIPFAPFLVFATFLALFFGEKIIDWYLKLFLI